MCPSPSIDKKNSIQFKKINKNKEKKIHILGIILFFFYRIDFLKAMRCDKWYKSCVEWYLKLLLKERSKGCDMFDFL